MKKLHLLLLIAFISASSSFKSQSSLWGVTPAGAGNGAGSIFGVSTGSNAFSSQFNMTDNSGSQPLYTKLLEVSGKFYGMTSIGGGANVGVLFEYDPVVNTYTTLASFTGTTGTAMGSQPNGALIQASSNGKLYGMTRIGGAGTGLGGIFSFDLSTRTYSLLASFTGSTGAVQGSQPMGSLLEASDGKLYGMTRAGGANNIGAIFSIDPSSGTYSVLVSFTGTSGLAQGSSPQGSLIEGTIGKLYGLTSNGGNGTNTGVLFEYDMNSGVYTNIRSFIPATGSVPDGSLIKASNGKYYGTTTAGGAGVSAGVLFEFDYTNTVTPVYTDVADMSSIAGVNGGPFCTLVQASNGKLYGTTRLGGTNTAGTIFEYDIVNATFAKRFDMTTGTGGTGSTVLSSLVQYSGDGKLYGMTQQGGINSAAGVIFSFDPTSYTYTKKLDFGSSTGGQANGPMVLASNGKMYGMTPSGGTAGSTAVSNGGVIYEYDYTTNIYTKKADLTSTNGRIAFGGFVQASNGNLYGLTSSGGANGFGSLIQYVPAASTYSKLVDFGGTAGSTPYGTPVLAANGNLYGLTSAGGNNGTGALFEYNITSSTYTNKYSFGTVGSDGSTPYGSLCIASNGKAYGLTTTGGTSGVGVLFEYDITTGIYTKKIDLTVANGSIPYGALVQGANSNLLYGLTSAGGANNLGVLFEYNISTNTYTKKMDFSTANGASPKGSLVKAANGKVYGLTMAGGANGQGVLFEYDPVAPLYTKKMDLSVTTGGSPGYTQLTEVCILPAAASAITSTNSLCQGDASTQNFSISTIANATSYTWTVPAGAAAISGSTTNSFNVNLGGVAAGVYTVSAGGVNVCGTGTLSSKTLSINALPSLSVTSGTICPGDSFTITPSGASTYTLQSGSTVTPSVSTNYTVIGTDINGCNSASPVTSSVTVRPSPAITVTSGSVCTGGTFNINPQNVTSYTIVNGGTATVTPSGTTTYSVNGTGANGCTSTITAYATVTVNAIPTIAATGGSVCSGSSFSITHSGAGAGTYTIIPGSTFSVSPSVNTTYSISGTSTAGCVSSAPATVVITVSTTPTVAITSGSICSGSSFSINPQNATTYTILPGGSAVVSPTTTTNYTVNGSSVAGCVSASVVATVTVYTTPTISATSGSVCSASNSFSLNPSGANVYVITPGGNAIVTPTTTTTYSVSGTTTAGCASANTATAMVTVNASPTIGVVSGSVCSGKAFTINPTGAGVYSVSGNNFTVTPSTTTSYTVTGASNAGCPAVNTVVSTVTVYTTPSVSVNSGSICSGSVFSINPSSSSGATSYAITGNNFTVSPSVNTSYSVTGSSTAGCISAPAVLTVSVYVTPTITVNSGSICSGSLFSITPNSTSGANTYVITGNNFTVSPSATTSYSVVGTSSAGCVSGQVVSTVSVSGSPVISVNSGSICPYSTFTISPSGNANTYTVSGGSFTVNPSVSTSYTVTGTNTAGCLSNSVISSVTVNPFPPLTVNGGPLTVCAGQTVTLIASGGVSYTWTPSSSSATLTDVPLATTAYSVFGASAAGCTATYVTVVTVNALPSLTIASGAICPGNSFTLSPSGANTYTFSGGSAVVSPGSTTSYSVFGTDANGCVNTVPAMVTVTVTNTLPVAISGANTTCNGSAVVLTAGGASTYSWSTGEVTNTISVSPSGDTIYQVTGSSGSCSNSAGFTLTVFALPTFSIASSAATLCIGETATLVAVGSINSYTWLNTSQHTSSIAVSPVVNTTYTVIGMDFNCSNTVQFIQPVNDCSGVGFASLSKTETLFSAYPNPNNGTFTIDAPKAMTISIVNTLGQVVLTQQLEQGSNMVNVGGQAKGIYFIQAVSEKQAKTVRIAIQ